jgi:hypothetical protein
VTAAHPRLHTRAELAPTLAAVDLLAAPKFSPPRRPLADSERASGTTSPVLRGTTSAGSITLPQLGPSHSSAQPRTPEQMLFDIGFSALSLEAQNKSLVPRDLGAPSRAKPRLAAKKSVGAGGKRDNPTFSLRSHGVSSVTVENKPGMPHIGSPWDEDVEQVSKMPSRSAFPPCGSSSEGQLQRKGMVGVVPLADSPATDAITPQGFSSPPPDIWGGGSPDSPDSPPLMVLDSAAKSLERRPGARTPEERHSPSWRPSGGMDARERSKARANKGRNAKHDPVYKAATDPHLPASPPPSWAVGPQLARGHVMPRDGEGRDAVSSSMRLAPAGEAASFLLPKEGGMRQPPSLQISPPGARQLGGLHIGSPGSHPQDPEKRRPLGLGGAVSAGATDFAYGGSAPGSLASHTVKGHCPE